MDINWISISFVVNFRKDFEKKMQEREVEEAIERIRYRKQLDEKSDREKEKIAGFYKDVSNFQVIYNILIKLSLDENAKGSYYKQYLSITHICLRNTKWMLRR